MNSHARPIWIMMLLGMATFWACGCSEVKKEYGDSKGTMGAQSLNGFGALRNAYSKSGFRTRDISRLTRRVQKSQVVVWTPKQESGISKNVTKWFEKWLAGGDRTLIYILPDSGSETDYWREMISLAPPDQRIEFRKRFAESINQRMDWRLNRVKLPSNGWFSAQPIPFPQPFERLEGTWAFDQAPDKGSHTISSEFLLEAYEPPPKKNASGAAGNPKTGTPTPTTPNMSLGPTGPSAIPWAPQTETSPSETKTTFHPMLQSVPGGTIVAEIQSKKWKNSRVFVVGGGSYLTNYGLTRRLGKEIAKEIIRSSAKVNRSYDRNFIKQVGFLTTDWRGVAISDQNADDAQVSGMELLTVWPISLITIHGVLLGFVVCLVLFPIFGRPRKIEKNHQSDFADHLDAVAALMHKTGGDVYARGRISEYFKRIRGETSGPWSRESKLPNLQTSPSETSSTSQSTAAQDSHSNKSNEPSSPGSSS